MAGNSVLAKMAVQISANNAEFARAMTRSQKDLHNFTTGVTKMAGVLGVAFGVQQIGSFALEVSKLAGEAKAVRAAFELLPESTKLMMDLKDATGGTVSELDLMKRAVQASNFGISLQALPKLLEFATLRAQQTGQSVDYLVDSIVTGIGRKSKLILDNLGISAVQLNEALGDTAIGAASIGQVADAVGTIIDENLSKMNGFSENSSTKLERLSASWTNLKVAIGEAANETGLLGAAIDTATGAMDVLASKDLSFIDKLTAFYSVAGLGMHTAAMKIYAEQTKRATHEAKSQAKVISEVDEAFVKFNGNIDEFAKAISPDHPLRGKFLEEFQRRMVKATDEQITTVGELRAVEKELLAERESLNSVDLKSLEINSKQIQAIREKIKAIDDLLIKEKEIAAHTLSQTAQRSIAGQSVDGVTGLSGLGFVPVNTAAIEERMKSLGKTSAEVTTEISQNWIDLSGSIAGSIATLAEGLGGAIVGVEDFGVSVIKAFVGFAREFGSMLIASGVAALALNKLITNPVGAIAAGAALVAISGAASAALSKSHSGLTGGGSGSVGRTPSEMGFRISGRTKGYDLVYTIEKEGYRRGRFA